MIKLQNITKKYNEKVVLNDFSLTLEDNKITCILGPSGSGKTTILNILSGIINYEGTILNKPQKPSYIFQEPRLIQNLTIKNNLELVVNENQSDKVEEILINLELKDKMNKYPKSLSGGEAQRVNLARAILYNGDILLADEPYSNLDTGLKVRLLNTFINAWNSNPKTTLFVTHNIEEAMMVAHKIIIIDKGKIINEFLNDDPFPREYGKNSILKDELFKIIINL